MSERTVSGNFLWSSPYRFAPCRTGAARPTLTDGSRPYSADARGDVFGQLSMTSDELDAELQSRLAQAFPLDGPGGGMAGRGIVTCAGGVRLFSCAYVLVRVLRETLQCRLPIQLWHFGGQEISPLMRALLVQLEVELVDATAVLENFPADIRDGWQLKAYAVAHCRFAEVLFLDADQTPVRDPEFLFETPQYGRAGALFWPDIVDLAADNPIWAWVGLAGETCPSWESGQFVVDKRVHWAPLQVALLLNERAEAVYGMLYGDKDTFLIAWRLADATVEIAPHRPFTDHRVLVQRDFDGAPLFQHRTNSKWSYHPTQYQMDGFVHMEACLGFLEALRTRWNGRLFFPPDRSLVARMEEARLQTVRGVRLILVADDELELELLEGYQIGLGRSVDRQNWYVVETVEGLELILHDGDQVTYRLAASEPGAWRGERLVSPANEARVDEGMARRQPSHASGVIQGGGLLDALVDAGGHWARNTPQSRSRLISALRLVLQAEPGLEAGLRALGERSEDLRAVADEVLCAFDAEQIRPLDKSVAIGVLGAGYRLPGDSGS